MLERTLGYFRDPDIGWVQTPQWFYDVAEGRRLPEALGRRLRALGRGIGRAVEAVAGPIQSGENPFVNDPRLFYEVIQRRRNWANAAFCCGSGSIHRREAVLQASLRAWEGAIDGVGREEAAVRHPRETRRHDLSRGPARRARHIVFLLGLIAAFGIIIALESWEVSATPVGGADVEVEESADRPDPAALWPLTDAESEAARTAWPYFTENTDPRTGLVATVAGYPATTMWDTGSYLLGLIAAERLEIVGTEQFDTRMARALRSLAELPLVQWLLPNKSHDIRTLDMTTYQNEPSERGIRWSALDVARVLVPIEIVLYYPEDVEAAQAVLDAWDLGAMVQDDEMIGLAPAGEEFERVQEGRFGQEQYAARAMALLGYDVAVALGLGNVGFAEVAGVSVPVDLRDPELLGAHSYTLSEPTFCWAGIRLGRVDARTGLAASEGAASARRGNGPVDRGATTSMRRFISPTTPSSRIASPGPC